MTDETRVPNPVQALQHLPRGTMVIFRHYGVKEREALGRAVVRAAHAHGHKVLVAGDWHLAWALRADGVHLPEHLAGEARALKVRRPDWIVTTAAHSHGAVRKAERAGADAALLSPIFATQSHVGAKVLGVRQAAQIAQTSVVPLYALGGVNEKTARLLQGTRLYGFAAIGAWL